MCVSGVYESVNYPCFLHSPPLTPPHCTMCQIRPLNEYSPWVTECPGQQNIAYATAHCTNSAQVCSLIALLAEVGCRTQVSKDQHGSSANSLAGIFCTVENTFLFHVHLVRWLGFCCRIHLGFKMPLLKFTCSNNPRLGNFQVMRCVYACECECVCV